MGGERGGREGERGERERGGGGGGGERIIGLLPTVNYDWYGNGNVMICLCEHTMYMPSSH